MDPTKPANVLTVSAGTSLERLTPAILKVISLGMVPVLEFVGAGAGNQAMKAVAQANGEMAVRGKMLAVVPVFLSKATSWSEDATVMQLRCKILEAV